MYVSYFYIYVCMYIDIDIFRYIQIDRYTYTCIYIHMCIHVCVCVCVHVCDLFHFFSRLRGYISQVISNWNWSALEEDEPGPVQK